MKDVRITHIGGPTVLIEVDGWRLLTDPTFDPAGGKYRFGWGTGSRKAGRTRDRCRRPRPDRRGAAQPRSPRRQSRPRRAGAAAHRRVSWSRPLRARSGWAATRAGSSHGRPRGSRRRAADDRDHRHAVPPRPAAEPPDRRRRDRLRARLGGSGAGVLWISGDTVLYDGVREVAERLQVDTALLHLGGVRFPVSGPVRYTMTAPGGRGAVRARSPAHGHPDPLRGLEAFPARARSHRARVRRARQTTSAGAFSGCPLASASTSVREQTADYRRTRTRTMFE